MNIEILNLFPAMIVVSIERENEFEQERENESSENARENRTSWREEPRQLTVSPTKKHFRNKMLRRVKKPSGWFDETFDDS